MPSGPESFVAQPSYSTELLRAKALLLAHPGRWRVVYHYDGDGIASASSAVRALQRLGYPVHASALVGVEREKVDQFLTATPGPVLVVDTGASWLDRFAQHPHPVIILDHHAYPGSPNPPTLPDHVAFVNPLDWGVDGMTELCAATLTWLFTIWLDPVNWDNAPWGLSGGIADRQHVGGFLGVSKMLVDEAVVRGLIGRRPRLPLFGPTVEAGLVRSIDPYVRKLSGRPDEVRRFLAGLSIETSRPLTALDAEEERRLRQALASRLAQQGVRPEFVSALDQDRYWVPSLALDAEELSNYQNACGREAEPGVGVAIALGDPSALDRARQAEEAWRSGILRVLQRIEDNGVNTLRTVQWFESADTTLAGTQAGLAMNYLLDPNRPVFVFSNGSDRLKVSGRGTRWLVSRGLNLSVVLREAAAAVGGEGGGHPVASGATIPAGSRDTFLERADQLVGAQLGPTGAPR